MEEKELNKEELHSTCEEECNCDEHCDSKEECNCDEHSDSKEENHGKHEKKKEKHKDKLKEAYNKISELEDKLLREKAEMVNYRHRKEDEVSRMLKYKDEELVTELLPIIDNLESAIKMDDNNLNDELSKFLEGFKMIYANIISILEKYEIKPIDGVNKPFDPTYHQAVLTEKVEDKESGIVLDVLRKGYLLKDKVIRPAMVKVSE
jgi:molecular chaperone GrpE